MIKIYDFLYLRIADYAHKYQSGLDIVTDFNTRLAEVQAETYNDLSPYYQVNEKVRGILQPWVKLIIGTCTNSTYSIAVGSTTFDRIIASSVTDVDGNILFEINPITEGELVMSNRIPQRKPDYSQKRVYYLINNPNTVILKPLVASLHYLTYYLIYPTEAHIAFTFSSTVNEDIMTYDASNSTDLGWNQDAENIILYKMLEKYGIANRDQWIEEYARLGINMTLGGETK